MDNIAEDFLSKLESMLPDESQWIYQWILNNFPLSTIAERFIELDNYDGNYLTASTSAIFFAYISYKRGVDGAVIDDLQKFYLISRGGVLCSSFIDGNYTAVTASELIRQYEGNDGFLEWLRIGADNIEHELEQYELNDDEGNNNNIDQYNIGINNVNANNVNANNVNANNVSPIT